MIVLGDKADVLAASTEQSSSRDETIARGSSDTLEIGLLNNMPDQALQATERQFIRLLHDAAGERPVRLHFYALPTVTRSPEMKARLDVAYHDVATLKHGYLDGLIVTGAEPKTERLTEESYWPELADIIDWAKTGTTSAIWSCLAAHAAVLHLDGIVRRRRSQKCSGVFAIAQAAEDPLIDNLRWPLRIFHSRHNDVAESDLVAHDYRVLTRGPDIGVDTFVKRYESLFVFFQGHPEYDPLSLRGEYLRDVGRYLTGKQENYPSEPSGYFDETTTTALRAFRVRARNARDPATVGECRAILERSTVTSDRRGAAKTIFRNWLAYLAENRTGARG